MHGRLREPHCGPPFKGLALARRTRRGNFAAPQRRAHPEPVMSIKFPSAEWTEAFKNAVNASAGYRAAGKGWTHGQVAYVLKADARIGTTEDMAMVLDLHAGECRGAMYVPASQAQDAEFVIVAEYPKWKEVLSGQVDPTKAMMQNKLKLQKGHLPTIVKYVVASKELVQSATAIDTDFPPVA